MPNKKNRVQRYMSTSVSIWIREEKRLAVFLRYEISLEVPLLYFINGNLFGN